jgi:hypothetical protein
MTKISKLVLVSSLLFAGAAIAGDAAKPAPDAKKPDMGKPADAKKPEMPKPAQQVADRVKAMTGTWKCEGTAAGMDGKDTPFKGSMTSKADLDGFFVHDSFSGTMAMGKFKFESYSTFDANGKKWHTVMVDNWGGTTVGTGDEMKDGKMDTMSDTMDMMGKGMMKDHTDVSDMKKGAHMWGEGSHDGGKTWAKVYDMTCKK